MDNQKRNRLIGSDHARRLYRHVTYGFHSQFESNDPLVNVEYSPEDVEVQGLERLCACLGLIAVDHGRVDLYGRSSVLASLFADEQGRPIMGSVVERAFWTSHVYPMSDMTNIRLATARDRLTNATKLKHKVCEHHPYLRDFDHNTVAEVVLHEQVQTVKVIDGTVGSGVVHQVMPNLYSH
jgi:hypothetical protein